MNDSENINTHLLKRVSNALAKYAIPDFTGGFTARIGGWEISVPADGWCVPLANTAAGVYTTLPWEYAATVALSGDTLVFQDSTGSITAEIKIANDLDEILSWLRSISDQYIDMIYTYVLNKADRDEIIEYLLEETPVSEESQIKSYLGKMESQTGSYRIYDPQELGEIQKKLTKSKKLWVLERFFPDTTEGRIILDYYIYDPKSEDPDYSESEHALENLWPLTIPSDNGEWQESGFMGSGKFGEWYSVRRWEP